VADAPVAPQDEAPVPGRAAERVEQVRLTTRRLFGLDRSGPPPPATLSGHPLNPWTIPNAIGFVRLALIPVFLWLEFSSGGSSAAGAVIFAVIAWSDYADGMAARITGQYSRLGAILDPVTDRLLIISGVVVCFRFELLPRWALAILIARELFMLVAGRMAMTRGLELRINWPGRLAVWPTMAAIFFALVGWRMLGELLLYIGLALTLLATAMYVRDALAEARARRNSPPTPSS
jgi:cardiolipin synthase